MAFSALKAERVSKQTSSFISPVTNEPDTAPIDPWGQETSPWLREPGAYSEISDALEIRTDKFGRGIWTTTHIGRGSCVFKTAPHVFALSSLHLESCCSTCCGTQNLKRCTLCKTIYYCSAKCQTKDWPAHKLECKSLQSWLTSSPDSLPPGDAVRCLGRLLRGQKLKGSTSIWWREIAQLQSHRDKLTASSAETHTHLAHSLVRYMGLKDASELEVFGLTSARDLVDITSRFTANTFTLTSPSLAPIGVAISPATALINHSCAPNAVVVFPRTSRSSEKEPLLEVIAIQDIPPYHQIFTSYIDTSLPRLDRQKALKETYCFDCTCSLCDVSSSLVDPREALWCSHRCGGSCRFDREQTTALTFCNACGKSTSISDEARDLIHVSSEALHKATALQFSDPAKALALTTRITPLLAPIMPITTHPLFGITRLRQSLLIASLSAQGSLADETILTAARSVRGLLELFPEGHPVRSIGITELGKLLTMDETPATRPFLPVITGDIPGFPPTGAARLRLAHETLLKALGELRISFGGEGGEVGREVADMVKNIEKELAVWSQTLRHTVVTPIASKST